MPFSDFYEEEGNSYADISLDTALMDSFAENLAVIPADYIDDKVLEDAGAGILIDLNSSVCLFAQNVFEKKYPASLTKIMTAYVALKYGNLEDTITCSSNVSDLGFSDAVVLGLKAGDSFTLDQALHLMLLSSYNDVAVAIAEYISGSVDSFCELMNQEALSLGATSTHFTNPHGLPDDDHYTTAYDLYLIFNAAIQNPTIMEIIQCKEYHTTYYNSAGSEVQGSSYSTNQYFQGNYEMPDNVTILGGKTGTTTDAGYCLMLLVRDKYSNPYISIILGDDSRDDLYRDMSDLMTEVTN